MTKETLIEKLFRKYEFENKYGVRPTFQEKVKLIKMDRNEQGEELLYNRGIILIASGRNTGFIDDRQVTLGNSQFVIIAATHPAECKTFMIDQVLKGVYIDLDLKRLQKIHSLLDKKPPVDPFKTPKNIVTGNMNEEIDSAFNRLMNILLDPQDTKVLGDHILDEIYYSIINTVTGEHLLQLCCQLTHFSRISTIVDDLQNHLEKEINIDDLAKRANMSRANFHKKFKEIYNDSPIQYIKKIRLNKARQYIIFDKMKIVDASSKVGYESPAQFSREFKNHFGFPPSDLKKMEI